MPARPNATLAARRDNLHKRARILQQIRAFFSQRAYLEVETPHRIPCNAPEEYILPQESTSAFLHTSPELCMKRLLAAGYAHIFQICRCWRKAERGRKHLPEFTMLEWYCSPGDYLDLMRTCEELLCALVPDEVLVWQGTTIQIKSPFERVTLSQAFTRYAPISLQEAMQDDIFEEVYTDHVEPQLGIDRPTFVYDYPTDMAALARCRPDAPHLAERVELYLGGLELANGFSELVDPTEQRQRFCATLDCMQVEFPERMMPEPFLSELRHMPPSAGIALGVDRLVMLLTDAATIDAVVAFTPEEL
ncbi:MAG: EF-P lysine aminoacylase EpmA [Desulfuromonadaceae bacterium]|nr:EF-P lysine aminoacylase EpmA [Desulfuromonadaceae bacterium]